jgi:hypothetical protein
MPIHSQQAFSAPSKRTLGLNPKGNLNSIASISDGRLSAESFRERVSACVAKFRRRWA